MDRAAGPASIDWRQAYFMQTFSLAFNGLNDYVRLPAISLVDPGSAQNGFTIEVTFKCSSGDGWLDEQAFAGHPPGVLYTTLQLRSCCGPPSFASAAAVGIGRRMQY